MNEGQWVGFVIEKLEEYLRVEEGGLSVHEGKKLPYAYEVRQYADDTNPQRFVKRFQTDILITEQQDDGGWTPRVIFEAKLRRITTHSAITYGQKAAMHREVHPYLRYGIFLGARQHYPLPGRLYRHGSQFDFMLSWKGTEPTDGEWQALIRLLEQEVRASQQLEEVLYRSRKSDREHYTLLHRRLHLEDVNVRS